MSNALKRKVTLYPGKVVAVDLYPGKVAGKDLYPGYVEFDIPQIPDANSIYPPWWVDTITIYNKFTDEQTQVVSWFKTVLKNCFWQLRGAELTIGESVLDSKSIVCRIPKNPQFLDKEEWLKTPNDKMGNYFTLGQGDIIVRGECDFTINEYASGKRSSDLLAKYKEFQECMEITEYSNNARVARIPAHYLARGK